MFDNYYFEALILKRHSLRKVELLQLIDELMQRKSDIYNKLKKKEKQLEKAIEGLELIANYGVSAWDIANTRHCLRQVKELEK